MSDDESEKKPALARIKPLRVAAEPSEGRARSFDEPPPSVSQSPDRQLRATRPSRALPFHLMDQVAEDALGTLVSFELKPTLNIPESDIFLHVQSPLAARLLPLVDGTLTYSELLDASGLGRADGLRTLVELVGMGLIGPVED